MATVSTTWILRSLSYHLQHLVWLDSQEPSEIKMISIINTLYSVKYFMNVYVNCVSFSAITKRQVITRSTEAP